VQSLKLFDEEKEWTEKKCHLQPEVVFSNAIFNAQIKKTEQEDDANFVRHRITVAVFLGSLQAQGKRKRNWDQGGGVVARGIPPDQSLDGVLTLKYS